VSASPAPAKRSMKNTISLAQPNHCGQARPGYAWRLIGAKVPGAPVADRSALSPTHMPTNRKSDKRTDVSRFIFQFPKDAAPFGWGCVGALVLLLTTGAHPANAAENKAPKTSIPKIASIAGIEVGYSSMEELEARLGKGKVAVGGHSNGARFWRVKGTAWVIYADAFEYSERGMVLDSLSLSLDTKPRRGVPYARLTKNDFAWLGKISLGMDEDKLLEIMQQNSCAPTKVAGGWLVKAKGCSPFTSWPSYYREWTVRFGIKEKSLVAMELDAR
jgi:hypothetical protein